MIVLEQIALKKAASVKVNDRNEAGEPLLEAGVLVLSR